MRCQTYHHPDKVDLCESISPGIFKKQEISAEVTQRDPMEGSQLSGSKRHIDFEAEESPAKREKVETTDGQYVRVRVGENEEAVALMIAPQPRQPEQQW